MIYNIITTHNLLSSLYGNTAATSYNCESVNLLVAIHGFGESQAYLTDFAETAANKGYAVWTIDLPAHGNSVWQKDVYNVHDTVEIVETILALAPHTETLSFFGYSLGGKVVFATLQHLKTHKKLALPLRSVYLAAPAGAPLNIFHPYIKVPILFKKIVISLAQYDGFMIKLSNILFQIGIIDKFKHGFTKKYLENKENKAQMFSWWYSISNFPFSVATTNAIFDTNQTKIHFLFGTTDTVIPKNADKWFRENLRFTTIQYIVGRHRTVMSGAAKWFLGL